MAVQAVLGATPAWHSEVDVNASKILAHHWPEVPNLGDLTKLKAGDALDSPVDIVTAGYP
jgi:DNA (cytosine-5)-methyltransferase 1